MSQVVGCREWVWLYHSQCRCQYRWMQRIQHPQAFRQLKWTHVNIDIHRIVNKTYEFQTARSNNRSRNQRRTRPQLSKKSRQMTCYVHDTGETHKCAVQSNFCVRASLKRRLVRRSKRSANVEVETADLRGGTRSRSSSIRDA